MHKETCKFSFSNSKLSNFSPQNSSIVLNPVRNPERCLCDLKLKLNYRKNKENFFFLEFCSLTDRQHKERYRKRVASMVKKLSQRRTAFCSSGLLSVNGIQCWINEYASCREKKAPTWNILLKSVIVDQHHNVRGDNEQPSNESQKIGGDPEWHEADCPFPEIVHLGIKPSPSPWFVLVVV